MTPEVEISQIKTQPSHDRPGTPSMQKSPFLVHGNPAKQFVPTFVCVLFCGLSGSLSSELITKFWIRRVS